MKEISVRAAGIVVNKNKQICLISEYNKHHFPGGHVENETIENAAKREIFEETGLKLKAVRKLGIVERPSLAKSNTIRQVHLFLFKTNSEEIFEKEKGHTPLWFEFNEAVNVLISKEEKEFLMKHRNEILR